MADATPTIRVPAAANDLGRALGRDLPASLASVRALARQVKIAAGTNTKPKGG